MQDTVGFGESVANPVTIDLHVRIFERLPVVEVDITQQLLGAARAGIERLPDDRRPDDAPAAALASNMRVRNLRMIQLHDIARLAARRTPMTGTQPSACRRTGGPCRRWNSRRDVSRVIPPDVLARLERACPRRLRRACRRQTLTDVAVELLDRGVPRHRMVTDLDGARALRRRSHPAGPRGADRPRGGGAVHALAGRESMDPHAAVARILHWARSRPPRYETWHSVVAALRDVPVEVAPAQRRTSIRHKWPETARPCSRHPRRPPLPRLLRDRQAEFLVVDEPADRSGERSPVTDVHAQCGHGDHSAT